MKTEEIKNGQFVSDLSGIIGTVETANILPGVSRISFNCGKGETTWRDLMNEHLSPAKYSPEQVEKMAKAAPDMLEALKNIVNYEDRGRAKGEPRISDHWYNIAKAAIAKATE